MGQIFSEFLFLGHGASKWTNEELELDGAIERIKLRRGVAKFLIYDPRKDGCKQTEKDKILKSMLVLRQIQKTHNTDYECMIVKLYTEIPTFRLAFINQNTVLVGHYKVYTDNSNRSPIMVFLSNPVWSFYTVYRTFFENEWTRANNLNTEWEDLKNLYKQRSIEFSKGE